MIDSTQNDEKSLTYYTKNHFKHAAYFHSPNKDGDYSIHIAISKYESFELYKKIYNLTLYYAGTVILRDKYGWTIMHFPYSDTKIFEHLLKMKFPLNLQDHNGNTPLHIAVLMQAKTRIIELIAANAELSILNNEGLTAYDIAKNSNFVSLELMLKQALIDQNKKVEKYLHDVNSAAAEGLEQLDLADNLKKYYLRKRGLTYLMRCAMQNKIMDIANFLFITDEDERTFNSIDFQNGDTALHIAARHCSLESLKVLIGSGCETRRLNFNGETFLHILVRSKVDERKLIEFMVELKEVVGDSIWGNLIGNRNRLIVNYAIIGMKPGLAKFLIENGAVFEAVNKFGDSALHLAAFHKLSELTRFLLSIKANPNILNAEFQTPIHSSVMSNDAESFELLVEHGARLDICDSKGHSPFALSIIVNCESFMWRLLLRGDYDFEERDHRRKTYMHYAATNSSIIFIKELLRRGAPFDCYDDFGTNPILYALNNNRLDVFYLFSQLGAKPERVEITSRGGFCLKILWEQTHPSSEPESYGFRP